MDNLNVFTLEKHLKNLYTKVCVWRYSLDGNKNKYIPMYCFADSARVAYDFEFRRFNLSEFLFLASNFQKDYYANKSIGECAYISFLTKEEAEDFIDRVRELYYQKNLDGGEYAYPEGQI